MPITSPFLLTDFDETVIKTKVNANYLLLSRSTLYLLSPRLCFFIVYTQRTGENTVTVLTPSILTLELLSLSSRTMFDMSL